MQEKINCRLQSRKRTNQSTKYVVWFPPQTQERIKSLKDVYKRVLGREVSTSIILRRSLQVLANIIEDRVKEGDTEKLAIEAANLMSLIR